MFHTYLVNFSDIFAQNFKTNVLTTQKKVLLECLYIVNEVLPRNPIPCCVSFTPEGENSGGLIIPAPLQPAGLSCSHKGKCNTSLSFPCRSCTSLQALSSSTNQFDLQQLRLLSVVYHWFHICTGPITENCSQKSNIMLHLSDTNRT